MNYDTWLNTNPAEEQLPTCSMCDDTIDIYGIDTLTIINDEIICQECLETEFITCDNCGEYFSVADDTFNDEKGLCEACAAESE